MPEFKEVMDFPSDSDNLKQLPVFRLGKLLFTTLNAELNPYLLFGDMIARFKAYPLEDLIYRPDLSKEFMVEAHWALYCENYLEGFHIPFVHEDLNEIIDYNSYQTELFPYSNLQLGISKTIENCFELSSDSKDYGLNVAAYYFWVFPNLMFNFYPWGLSLNIIEPIGSSRSKVRFLSFVYDETKLEHGAGSDLDKVEFEDEEIVINVQKGIRSRFYEHGRYSVTKEQGTHHFHRLLAEQMNK
jgi:choline monooxygenase